jgi:hypothetical protein
MGAVARPTPKSPAHDTPADTTAAVDAFMAALDHPSRALVEQLRRVVTSVDPAIAEGIKWNAPSFRTTEYFATTNLRAKRGIRVVLHLGARARELPDGGITIDDPARLLKWLAKDRAVVEIADARSLDDGKAALQAILRQWIRFV